MKLIKRLTFLTVLLLDFLIESGAQSNLNYNLQDGFQSLNVYNVCQDSYGYLWFGTDLGCSRFDGKQFENFKVDDGLGDNNILRIYEDRQQRIWFLPFNGKLSFYKNGQIFNSKQFKGLDLGYEPKGLISFVEDNYKNIWIGSLSSELIKIDSNLKVSVLQLKGLKNSVFLHLRDSNTLAVIHGEDLDIIDCKSKEINILSTNFNPVKILVGNNVNATESYFLTDKGIEYWNKNRRIVIVPKNEIPPIEQIHFIYCENQQSIWVGGRRKAIYNFRQKADQETFELKDSIITSKFPIHMVIDFNKNLWITTAQKGVYKYSTSNNFREKYKLPVFKSDEKITCSIFANNNTVWYGNDYGQIIKYDFRKGKIIEQYTVGSNSNTIQNIHLSKDGCLYINTLSSMYYLVPYGKTPKLTLYNNNPCKINFKSIKEDRNGNIYFNAYDGIYRIKDTLKDKTIFKLGSPFPAIRTYNLEFGTNDEIWFENVERLNKVENNSITEFKQYDTLFASRIRSLNIIQDSILIVGSSGNGLTFIRNNVVIKNLTTKDGLLSNYVKNVFIRNNKIYDINEKGLNIITSPFIDSSIVSYPSSSKLPFYDINDIKVDSQNILMVTSQMVYSINSNYLSEKINSNIRFYITKVSFDQDDITSKYFAAIPHNYQTLVIQYKAITYIEPYIMLYRFSINKQPWQYTKEESLQLPYLQPGSYTFEVQAKHYNSNWSSSQYYRFTVLSPYYKKTKFQILSFLTLLALLYGVFYRYTQTKFNKKVRKLEKELLLDQERNRISADMHDDLGSDITHIILLSKNAVYQSTDPMAQQLFKRIGDSTNNILDKMHEIIWALNPSNDTLKSLILYLSHYYEEIPKQAQLRYSITLPKILPDNIMGAVTRRNIFLCFKEILVNAQKHSNGSEFKCIISIANNILSITIQDNGIGYDPLDIKNKFGNGLINIEKRMSLIHGYSVIESELNVGTKFTLFLPLNA